MNGRLLALTFTALFASVQSARADWLAGGVDISIYSFTVESNGWIQYDCGCIFHGSFSGAHVINDGASGTVVSRAISGDEVAPYSGSVSTGTTYNHCYVGSLSATGVYGASNAYNSGTMCAPSGPAPAGSEIDVVADKCDGPTGYNQPCSPIVINLSTGPWTFSGTDDPVLFDINANGRLNRITWTGRGEPLAFLALDRNGNGVIDDGTELFGTATPLASGAAASSGFDALLETDANADGVIDRADAIWTSLLLWADANHDGVSQAGEISRLTDTDVVALRTAFHEASRVDREGNAFRYASLLRLERGQRPYYDVFFRSAE